MYSLYLLAVGWVGLKLFVWIEYDVPPTRAANDDDVWRLYYPELWKSGAIEADRTTDDDRLDVLLLGASVLEQVAGPLEKALKARFDTQVRVYNLAISAHTTRDSAKKYERLLDRQFDLIVIYHGINDSRMNCVPAADYRDDYSHCAWYASFERKIQSGASSLRGLATRFRKGKIGLGPPDAENLKHGERIKTAAAFERNLESILRFAKAKKTPVLLMTFATHLPKEYSRAAFEAGKLDYGKGQYQLAVEVWGTPNGVRDAVEAHNGAIRKLHDRYPGADFIDMNARLPRDGATFSDVCHLTPAGLGRFVEIVMPAIERRFAKSLSPR